MPTGFGAPGPIFCSFQVTSKTIKKEWLGALLLIILEFLYVCTWGDTCAYFLLLLVGGARGWAGWGGDDVLCLKMHYATLHVDACMVMDDIGSTAPATGNRLPLGLVECVLLQL